MRTNFFKILPALFLNASEKLVYHEVQAIFLSVWVFPNSKILPPPPPPPPPPPSLPLLVLPSYFTLHLLHDSAAVCLTFGRKKLDCTTYPQL